MHSINQFTGLCRIVACLLLIVTLAGCAAPGAARDQPTGSHQSAVPQYDLSTAQDQIVDFADNYMTTIGNLYTRIERDQGNRPEVRREALRWWLLTARAAMINATDHNPVYGIVNMVILVRLQRHSYTQPWFEQTFGAPAVALADAVMAEQDRRISALADHYLTPTQAEELRVAIEMWLKEQPELKTIGLVRLQDLQVTRGPEETNHASPGSVFGLPFLDPFVSLDPAVREVHQSRLAARQMFYYAQRMPAILRDEAQLLSLDLLAEPRVISALENIDKLNSNAVAFLAISRQLSDDLAKLPANLRAEREKAIEQLSEMLTVQRDAAIQQIALATTKERTAAIEQLSRSVDHVGRDLIDQVAQATAKQRESALQEASSAISGSEHAALADVDAASKAFITRLVVGVCLAGITISVSVALVMLGYRWIASRLLPPKATSRK